MIFQLILGNFILYLLKEKRRKGSKKIIQKKYNKRHENKLW